MVIDIENCRSGFVGGGGGGCGWLLLCLAQFYLWGFGREDLLYVIFTLPLFNSI